MKELTRRDVIRLIKDVPKERCAATVCALVGHSRFSTACFGYRYCGRCEAQVGDGLAGVDNGAKEAVIQRHNCELCRANVKKLTWKDRLLMPSAVSWLAKPGEKNLTARETRR